MKVLLYSINYSPELTGIGKYSGELSQYLADRNIETHVVTAPPYYPDWKVHADYKNWWSQENYRNLTVYRCPLYVPRKVRTVKRLIHLFTFASSSVVRLFTLLKVNPDVVILVQPTLFCAPFALIYSKLIGAKSVLHIQDFEVDAMFGFGLVGDKKAQSKGFKRKVIYKFEAWLMGFFDRVSSISHSMMKHAQSKGVPEDKLIFFPNWSDTEFISPDANGDELRQAWGYSAEDKLVLYSGNIGQKQGLDIVLDAARLMRTLPNVKFLVVGDGAYKSNLLARANSMHLTNIQFLPLQDWAVVPQMLAMADVHLVVQKKGSADVVLPSKLTNILSVGGHALVTAEEDTELGVIEQNHRGVYTLVPPGDVEAFVRELNNCLSMNTGEPNYIARQYALANLNKETVISRFVKELEALTAGARVSDTYHVTQKD